MALVYKLIAGPDRCDTDVKPVPVEDPPVLPLAKLRIACAPALAGFPVAAAIRQGIEDLARELRRAGATVDEAALPELDFGADLAAAGALIGMTIGAFQPSPGRPATTLAAYLAVGHALLPFGGPFQRPPGFRA